MKGHEKIVRYILDQGGLIDPRNEVYANSHSFVT
jgi:hypothetical protein